MIFKGGGGITTAPFFVYIKNKKDMKKKFRNYSTLIGITLVVLLICGCSKKDESKTKQIKPVAAIPVENFSKLDVCGCNKQANIILDGSIALRKKFMDIKTLKENKNAIQQIRTRAKNWTSLMSACFMNHGANMWVPSECNNVEIIEEKKDILFNLGIQIEQGEKMRL